MAQLVPVTPGDDDSHPWRAQGWLDEHDPFFEIIEGIVEGRARPRSSADLIRSRFMFHGGRAAGVVLVSERVAFLNADAPRRAEGVAVGDLMPQEILCPPQLLARLGLLQGRTRSAIATAAGATIYWDLSRRGWKTSLE